MNWPHQIILFSLAGIDYAVDLASVERVIHIVEITPLPQAPEIVDGIINLAGRVIPVVKIRHRFGLPNRSPCLTDRILIVKTVNRTVGFVADSVAGVIDCPEGALEEAQDVFPGLEYIEGVMKTRDGVVLIHDLDTFLSIEEELLLDSALEHS